MGASAASLRCEADASILGPGVLGACGTKCHKCTGDGSSSSKHSPSEGIHQVGPDWVVGNDEADNYFKNRTVKAVGAESSQPKVKTELGMRVRLGNIKSERLSKLLDLEATVVHQNTDSTWNVLLDRPCPTHAECRQLVRKLREKFLFPVMDSDGNSTFDTTDYRQKMPPVKNGEANASGTDTTADGGEVTTNYSDITVSLSGSELQRHYGAQSLRGKAPQFQLATLDEFDHARACFDEFARNENEFCGEYACFYHSYTYAALLYEVHAAIASIFYGYDSQQAPLPRLLKWKFKKTPDAMALKKRFDEKFANDKKDHHAEYRDVGISVMCSLVATGPEVSTPVCFLGGYKHASDPVEFRRQLEEDLLGGLLGGGQKKKAIQKEAKELTGKIVSLAAAHHLDVSKFGHNGECDRKKRTGHMLQIFIRRDLVDQLCYASEPWGNIDSAREPISTWMDGDTDVSWGQARILADPDCFMKCDCVRMFVACADAEVHAGRQTFQSELIALLRQYLCISDTRQHDMKNSLERGWG